MTKHIGIALSDLRKNDAEDTNKRERGERKVGFINNNQWIKIICKYKIE